VVNNFAMLSFHDTLPACRPNALGSSIWTRCLKNLSNGTIRATMPRRPTKKQKLFALLALLVVAGILGGIVYRVRLHSGIDGGKPWETTVSLLYGLLSAFIIALIAFAFSPAKEWLQEYLTIPGETGATRRILLFGQTGCGKTSFALHVLTANPLETMKSTPDFTERPGLIPFANGTTLTVIFGDYRGEEPSQVTVNVPESFAGAKGRRVVDALIFFVDLIGREHDADEPEQVMDDEKLLQWVLEEPEDRIHRRINQHKSYLSAAVIEIFLTAVYSSRLQHVYFVITKADLLERAARTGALKGFSAGSLKDDVVNCFSDVIARINAACAENNIPPCSVNFISLRDESARRFVYDSFGALEV
jgi:hypothetical protein